MRAVVILGCSLKVIDNSYQAGSILISRLERALQLYQENETIFVVSGGVGRKPISEAEVMKQWLINRNIPSDIIICEDKSLNTMENIIFTKFVIDWCNDWCCKATYDGYISEDISLTPITDVTIVTSEFHVPRTERWARAIMTAFRLDFVSSTTPPTKLQQRLRNEQLIDVERLLEAAVRKDWSTIWRERSCPFF